MKFIISRASDYGWREYEKGAPINGACQEEGEDRWIIDVQTLDQLLEMIDQDGHSLIIAKCMSNGGMPDITIYDALVE